MLRRREVEVGEELIAGSLNFKLDFCIIMLCFFLRNDL